MGRRTVALRPSRRAAGARSVKSDEGGVAGAPVLQHRLSGGRARGERARRQQDGVWRSQGLLGWRGRSKRGWGRAVGGGVASPHSPQDQAGDAQGDLAHAADQRQGQGLRRRNHRTGCRSAHIRPPARRAHRGRRSPERGRLGRGSPPPTPRASWGGGPAPIGRRRSPARRAAMTPSAPRRTAAKAPWNRHRGAASAGPKPLKAPPGRRPARPPAEPHQQRSDRRSNQPEPLGREEPARHKHRRYCTADRKAVGGVGARTGKKRNATPSRVKAAWLAISRVRSAVQLAAEASPGERRPGPEACARTTSPPTWATGRRAFTASRTKRRRSSRAKAWPGPEDQRPPSRARRLRSVAGAGRSTSPLGPIRPRRRSWRSGLRCWRRSGPAHDRQPQPLPSGRYGRPSWDGNGQCAGRVETGAPSAMRKALNRRATSAGLTVGPAELVHGARRDPHVDQSGARKHPAQACQRSVKTASSVVACRGRIGVSCRRAPRRRSPLWPILSPDLRWSRGRHYPAGYGAGSPAHRAPMRGESAELHQRRTVTVEHHHLTGCVQRDAKRHAASPAHGAHLVDVLGPIGEGEQLAPALACGGDHRRQVVRALQEALQHRCACRADAVLGGSRRG